MICGIVLAAALVTQQAVVYLGKAENRQGVRVATNEATARMRSLEVRDGRSIDFTQPVGIAVVAKGTQVRIVRPTLLEAWEDGRLKTIDGYRVEILEGPLAGSRVVVSARNTYRGGPRELAPAAPKEPETSGRARIWLGGERTPKGVDLGVMVAASLDELAGSFVLPGKPDVTRGVKLVDAPAMVSQLGYGTRAIGFEVVKYQPGDGGPERSAALVKVLDGPAAGRVVYVDGSCVHVDEDSRAAASRESELRRTAAKQKARRSARVRAGKAREAADAAEVAKAEADYRKMLPLLLEQRRIQLDAMNQAQRNAALRRMSRAMEREAGAAEYKAGMPRTVRPDGTVGAR